MKTNLFIIVIILAYACGNPQPKKNCAPSLTISSNTKLLGHKGSGPINSFHNDGWHENGKPSILNALRNLDGSEVDIQMSADSTLWLFHDHEIKKCDGKMINIAKLRDTSIQRINKCQYNDQLLTLPEFNKLIYEEELQEKIISLDLKVLSNPENRLHEESDFFIKYITQKIKEDLTIKNLLLEVPFDVSADKVYEQTNLKTFSVCYEPKQIKDSMEHLSVPFDLLSSNDIESSEIQTWTPNTAQDLISTLNLTPEYIQVDNVKLGSFIRSIRDGDKHLRCVKGEAFSLSTADSEFEPIVQDTLLPSQPILYQITLDKRQNNEEQFVVLAITNEKGRVIKYIAHTLDQNLFYFFVEAKGSFEGSNYNIYIWNKPKKPLSLKGRVIVLQ